MGQGFNSFFQDWVMLLICEVHQGGRGNEGKGQEEETKMNAQVYQSCPKTLSHGSNNSEDSNPFWKSCFNLFLTEVSLDTMNTLRTAQWKNQICS